MRGALTREERQQVDEVRSDALAPGTLAGYRRYWKSFAGWLSDRGVPSHLPVDPHLVALYAVLLADVKGYVHGTIVNHLSGIRYMHRKEGIPSPTEAAMVKEVVAGLRRSLGIHSEQARPMYSTDIERIAETACNPRPSAHITMSEGGLERSYVALRRGLLDIALVRVMGDGLLRVSEAAELRWRDVILSPDGSGVICIRFSKGDPYGEGAYLWLSPPTMESLDLIRPQNYDGAARVFGRSGIGTLNERIARAAEAADLGPGYTSHSPRVGRIYELVAARISPTLIIHAARWSDPSHLAYYTRRQEVTEGAVAQYYAGSNHGLEAAMVHRPPTTLRAA